MISLARSFVKSFDLFPQPIAQLNVRGATTFRTTIGGLISMGIWAVILAFTYSRAKKLINRDDPFTSQVDEAIDIDDPPIMNLADSQFKFGVTAYIEMFEGSE